MWCVLQYEWRECAWKIAETCKSGKNIENCKVKESEKTWRTLYGKSSCKAERTPSGVGEIGRWTNLQHCAIESDFTLGITIIVGVWGKERIHERNWWSN